MNFLQAYRRIAVAEWELEVDAQATAVAYRLLGEPCSCAYCRNYRQAYTALPSELLQLLDSLGVDPASPVHTSEVCESPDGTHLYIVYYDVVGRIISGPDTRLGAQAGTGGPAPVELSPGVRIGITGEPYAPGHFPDPAIEFEFPVNLPWVIDESP
jgi:hypothetical protein